MKSESVRIGSKLFEIFNIFFPFEKYQNTKNEHNESLQKYNYYGPSTIHLSTGHNHQTSVQYMAVYLQA